MNGSLIAFTLIKFQEICVAQYYQKRTFQWRILLYRCVMVVSMFQFMNSVNLSFIRRVDCRKN